MVSEAAIVSAAAVSAAVVGGAEVSASVAGGAVVSAAVVGAVAVSAAVLGAAVVSGAAVVGGAEVSASVVGGAVVSAAVVSGALVSATVVSAAVVSAATAVSAAATVTAAFSAPSFFTACLPPKNHPARKDNTIRPITIPTSNSSEMLSCLLDLPFLIASLLLPGSCFPSVPAFRQIIPTLCYPNNHGIESRNDNYFSKNPEKSFFCSFLAESLRGML
ncbi:MAG: hypothetical protein J6P32_01435 [Stomatobaculum sp.]|nr:hypothetical protein [Stomatobaculum sp.]